MAILQVIDKTDTTHNYKNTEVRGHENRTKDSDVEAWYTKSVFEGEQKPQRKVSLRRTRKIAQ